MDVRLISISIMILWVFFPSTASSEIKKNNAISLQFSEVKVYKELTLIGSEKNLQISEIKTLKKNIKIDKKLRKAMQRKSDYFITLLNEEGKVIYNYAIGNPFIIHLQHSGYEGEISRVTNDNTEIVVYFPATLEPATINLKKSINEKAVTVDRISILR